MSKKNIKLDEYKKILYSHREFVVFDLETTGLSPEKGNEIIEIGAIRVVDGKIKDEFSSFVQPKRKIPAFISDLTGITNEMVNDAPNNKIVLPEFKNFINNAPLVAHNAPFDVKFLKFYLEKIDSQLQNHSVDTIPLLRELYPHLPNYKLGTVQAYFNCSDFSHHRAIDDARVTSEIFVYNICSKYDVFKYSNILSEKQKDKIRGKYLYNFTND